MSPRERFRRWQLAIAGLLVLLALLAYGPALAGELILDDVHSVSENPAIHDLGNLDAYWVDPKLFSRGISRMYRPALLTSFALNWAISPEPWSLKLGNVLLHAGCAVLLFRWLWLLGRRLRVAAVIAALFAVHPLASEAVNMVSSRSELLSTFGLLLGLGCHVRWQRGSRGERHGGATAALAWSGMLLGAVLACGSKETGVVLPLLLVVQTWCLRRGAAVAGLGWRGLGHGIEWRRAMVGLAPVVLAVVAYLIARKLLLGEVAVQLLDRVGSEPRMGYGRSLPQQLATMGVVLPGALRQCVWPWPLRLDPIVELRSSFADAAVLGGWALLAVVTVAAWWPGPTARVRRVGVAVAWAVAMPWILVPLNMPFAEHRMYGPLCGVAAIAAAVGPRLSWWRASSRERRLLQRVAVGAVMLLAAGASAMRSAQFRDPLALWRSEVASHDDSFQAWWGVATETLRRGDVEGALAPMRRAHELNPANYDAACNYAELLVSLPDERAQSDEAFRVTKQLRDESPGDPWVRTLLARAHLQAGRTGRGREHFVLAEQEVLSCLTIATPKGYVFQLAAEAQRGLGDLPAALAHLDTSIARGLGTIGVRLDRARLLRQMDRVAEANAELHRARNQAPFDPAVLQALQQAAAPVR